MYKLDSNHQSFRRGLSGWKGKCPLKLTRYLQQELHHFTIYNNSQKYLSHIPTNNEPTDTIFKVGRKTVYYKIYLVYMCLILVDLKFPLTHLLPLPLPFRLEFELRTSCMLWLFCVLLTYFKFVCPKPLCNSRVSLDLP